MKHWLEIVTNIGVIVGLILVAYQIDQANQAIQQSAVGMQMETFQAGGEVMGDFWMRIAENQNTASIWYRGNKGEELEPPFVMQYNLLAREYFTRIAAMHAMFEAHGEGRGGWAIAQVVQNVRQSPGLSRELRAYLEEQQERNKMGYYRPPNSESAVTTNPFWGAIQVALRDVQHDIEEDQ